MKSAKSDIEAFRMHGNVYFVGSSDVSVHAIDTEEGIVLIDTGYPYMYEQILDSMASVGLDISRVVALIHSHGHYDHFGCTERLKALTGAKTYISRTDNEIVNGTLDLSWAEELGFDRLPTFDCDVLIDPGDVLTFGSTTVRCEAAPGHTAGTLAFFITSPSDGGFFTAAMHGGIGPGSMSRAFLEKRGLSLECREKFFAGLDRFADEKVDLVLGNHPYQNKTPDKLAKTKAGESLLDPEEWRRFLDFARKYVSDYIAKEA
ncbi:MAG: MBL fold metallo-hydrolase [Clostridia bacterium]|nr:MBL fold metallo-hydrolase [Clostridia bacterium]